MTPDTSLHDIAASFAAFRPPKRVSVSQGAAESLYIKQPGGYTGPWSPDETPYMVEPMDELASRGKESVCFVGPARTGKTLGLLDGWMAHCVTNDPGDMLIVQMTQDKARDYSKTRVDRAIRHSPPLAAYMSASGHDDNTHDKMFKHGMWLKIAWPTVTQLSSSDYRYVGLTDYDRMPDDVDGEGSAFALGLKRTQTFMSRGMCMVESSPGREITDPNWKPATLHEAPPCGGILGIYNRSDRRRLYWPCPECGEYFEAAPGLDLFRLPAEDTLLETIRTADVERIATEYARIVCPHCEAKIGPSAKHSMNVAGRWVADGQHITRGGVLVGERITSTIAGFWLGGVAATYQSWRSLISRYLLGLRDFVLSGSELSLQSTVNTDQGMPYISKALAKQKETRDGPRGRRDATLERYIVPKAARFLVAAVDVQGGKGARFVVQVHAVGPHMEQWPIDRYSIVDSAREGVEGAATPIDPAAYPEDWDALTHSVIRSTYRIDDGRELRIRMIAVDTGGEDGVTDKAYDWFRRIRRAGDHVRVMLIKGASTKTAPILRQTMVGAKRPKDPGDVPLYLINPNLLKDGVAASFKRTTPGPGYMHIPAWLPEAWFDELEAEVRRPDGTWIKVRKRNETKDLCAYTRAAIIAMGADRINWDAPPPWARAVDENSEVITAEARRRLQEGRPAVPVQRRMSRSNYLSGK